MSQKIYALSGRDDLEYSLLKGTIRAANSNLTLVGHNRSGDIVSQDKRCNLNRARVGVRLFGICKLLSVSINPGLSVNPLEFVMTCIKILSKQVAFKINNFVSCETYLTDIKVVILEKRISPFDTDRR